MDSQQSEQVSSDPTLSSSDLAVVVITRNEARHIGACLEALTRALTDFPGTPVVVVDSNSSDETVDIARRYPVAIYRYKAVLYTAEAGRRIGFHQVCAPYVLFIDGDCYLEPNWLPDAVSMMQENSDIAIVHGQRHELFEAVLPGFESAGPAPEEYGLGGNALYRAKVLRDVGGFNPYIIAYEEQELLGRIQAAGYRAFATSDVMFTHYTVPKDTVRAFLTRCLRRYVIGPGQVLRVSRSQGLVTHYIRQFNRFLLTLIYLIAGVLLSLAGVLLARPALPLLWLSLGILAFVGLCWRRRSVRSAAYIVSHWLVVAVGLVIGFLKRPQSPQAFAPHIERVL